ncbi:cyclic nucleotide-gated ion channel 1 [Phtheirospermum japonicum]|uniref:Cyclic nucleotide-gated ion channel 1 n=1 Tax=Phtheirospermum japonicum TaxID=374723 RepID=A0A830B1W8_9LAMI|nr:cyclic nucleotide-gated ion channel 1 [Phtheirospermum japonicum]
MFEKMDDQLLDAMCDRLKPVLYTEDSYIVREGDPVDEMPLHHARQIAHRHHKWRTHRLLQLRLPKSGRFLRRGALDVGPRPHSSSNLPISTRTVQALSEVEAFALMADDLKFVASQFRRLHSKQLRHTFRFYSQQWRTWAACFVQAAWRRYCRKKLEESLREEENRLQDALAKDGVARRVWGPRFMRLGLRLMRLGLCGEMGLERRGCRRGYRRCCFRSRLNRISLLRISDMLYIYLGLLFFYVISFSKKNKIAYYLGRAFMYTAFFCPLY